MNRNVLTLGLLVLVGMGLSACNTAEGVGKDLSSAGDAIQGVFN
ncbi:MAG TPA: entericidin A/B family lipoprotein [Alphaproteobacteria bacterium]|jgi:predicted small secreted protein|nr:entericidin A/B family lipoprotein [Micavibrio sp.]MBK9562291.1 entericidin A/B family lipoprotein [Micavibrio sp.]MBP7722840.1 entericidin A/B family lipoprotein [Alphaproteobacteria bacterium]HQX28246.1 entericidin A/B family lipoprotein [Alphaproteobacteria bacterium]